MRAHPFRRARAATVACVLATALVAAGCSQDDAPLPDPPASVATLPATGAHEVSTDLRVAEMYERYGEEFSGFDVESYLLDGADWADVEAHYAAALEGWDADERFAPRDGSTQGRTWVDGDRVVVVEVVDADGTSVLLVGSNAEGSA